MDSIHSLLNQVSNSLSEFSRIAHNTEDVTPSVNYFTGSVRKQLDVLNANVELYSSLVSEMRKGSGSQEPTKERVREVRLGLSVLRNALFEVKASVQKIPHMTASAFGELTQLFAAIDRTYADYYRVQLSNKAFQLSEHAKLIAAYQTKVVAMEKAHKAHEEEVQRSQHVLSAALAESQGRVKKLDERRQHFAQQVELGVDAVHGLRQQHRSLKVAVHAELQRFSNLVAVVGEAATGVLLELKQTRLRCVAAESDSYVQKGAILTIKQTLLQTTAELEAVKKAAQEQSQLHAQELEAGRRAVETSMAEALRLTAAHEAKSNDIAALASQHAASEEQCQKLGAEVARLNDLLSAAEAAHQAILQAKAAETAELSKANALLTKAKEQLQREHARLQIEADLLRHDAARLRGGEQRKDEELQALRLADASLRSENQRLTAALRDAERAADGARGREAADWSKKAEQWSARERVLTEEAAKLTEALRLSDNVIRRLQASESAKSDELARLRDRADVASRSAAKAEALAAELAATANKLMDSEQRYEQLSISFAALEQAKKALEEDNVALVDEASKARKGLQQLEAQQKPNHEPPRPRVPPAPLPSYFGLRYARHARVSFLRSPSIQEQLKRSFSVNTEDASHPAKPKKKLLHVAGGRNEE